jgi:hypothetical protein
METILTELVSSAIFAVLSWGVGSILHRNQGKNRVPSPAVTQSGQMPPFNAPAVRPSATSVDFGAVLIHIGLLQFAVNVVGFVIGFTVGVVGSGAGISAAALNNIVILLVLIVGTIVAIIAFLIIGLRVDTATRWQHLVFVALGTVILTLLVNSLLGAEALTPAAIVFAFIQTFLAMGIGGGLATLFRPNRPPQTQYASQAGVPQYPYGAWPNAPQYPPAGAPSNAPQYLPQGASWQPGYGQQPPQYPPQAPAGWGQQPGAQPPMYPVPQHPPNQQQGNQGNQ